MRLLIVAKYVLHYFFLSDINLLCYSEKVLFRVLGINEIFSYPNNFYSTNCILFDLLDNYLLFSSACTIS